VEGLQRWGRWGSSSMAWSLREKVRGVNGMREREHGVLCGRGGVAAAWSRVRRGVQTLRARHTAEMH